MNRCSTTWILLGISCFWSGVAPAAEPAKIGSFRQLFLDDHLVAKMTGLRRVMHRPHKRGAVIRSPKLDQTIQTRSVPQWDPVAKLYKL